MGAQTIAAIVCGAFGCAVALALTFFCIKAVRAEEGRISLGERDGRLLRAVAVRARFSGRYRFLKILKIIFYSLGGALFVCILTLSALSAVTTRSLGKIRMPLCVLAVGSQSMNVISDDNPYADNFDGAVGGFDKYALIFLQSVPTSSLKLYDVVAYASESGIIIVHRIVRIIDDGNGKLSFVMCGDANSKADGAAVGADKIIGRYTGFKIDGLGAAVMFMNSLAGMITAAFAIYALGLAEWAYARIARAEKQRTEILLPREENK